MTTLTRAEAHERVDDCGADFYALNALAVAWGVDFDALNALAAAWGSGAQSVPRDKLKGVMHEFVDVCADHGADADKVRLRGNRSYEADADSTGLADPTDPDTDEPPVIDEQLDALSALLRHWCAAQALPYMSADELLCSPAYGGSLTNAQRTWLVAYGALWDLTN